MQKISLFHLFILQIQTILESRHMTSYTHFWPTPNIFNHLLLFIKLYQHAKNQLIPLVPSWDKAYFRVKRPDCPYPFLTMLNQEIFNQLLIFVDFYQHAKKWDCFINLPWRNSSFKNPATWLAESILTYVSETRSFPKYRICVWTQQIIKIFIMVQIQRKLMTKFFYKFKNIMFSLFLAHFSDFGGKNFFQKIGLSCTTS